MGLVQAFKGAIGGTFADQWKEIITAGAFSERTVVATGVLQQMNHGRGANISGSTDVISNGSKIFVPENTAAFVFNQGGIQEVITEPGGYTYQSGEKSIFNGEGVVSVLTTAARRIGFGGQSDEQQRIAFVNLREIRGIKFGTRGPLVYNDIFYGTDLEVLAYGAYSVQVIDPVKFVQNFLPPNVTRYSFDYPNARDQIRQEFLQSFIDAVNTLSTNFRISQLPSQSNELSEQLTTDTSNAGTWGERFGFKIVSVAIANIEFSPESRELVKEFSSRKMNLRAYEDVSQKAANIAAQQSIAQGVQEHGLGDSAGMIFGMNMGQTLNPMTAAPNEQKPGMSFDEQIKTLKKLKELMDAGILSQAEFDIKKKEIMGL